MLIVPIPAAATHRLRQSVLRPHQPIEEMAFDGDLDPDTIHFGALETPGSAPLAIASIYRKSPPESFLPAHPALATNAAWQLRGMATDPSIRGRGFGGQLLLHCLTHAAAHRGSIFWCNARTAYRGFYNHYGLQTFGPEFTPQGIGPHFFMFTPLPYQPSS